MKKKLVPALIAALIFFGCKSSDVKMDVQNVDPLSLLEENSGIYMSVPASKNQDLVSKILSSRISGLSEKNARAIAARTEILYAGLGTVDDRSRLQIVSETSIPRIVVQSSLSKKNGWEKTFVSFDAKVFEKFTHASDGFQAAFPSSNLVCAAQNVDLLLKKFAENNPAPETPWKNWIAQDLPQGEILFFITKPGQYLRSLIGQSINVGAESVFGSLCYFPDKKEPGKYSGKYELSFSVRLLDKRSFVVLKSLLALSFAMTGGTVEQVDSLTLKISGIEISEGKIAELFLRDPITGKHYKVVDDKVIEESVKK